MSTGLGIQGSLHIEHVLVAWGQVNVHKNITSYAYFCDFVRESHNYIQSVKFYAFFKQQWQDIPKNKEYLY